MSTEELNTNNSHHNETINVENSNKQIQDNKISENISKIIQKRRHLANRVEPISENLKALLEEIKGLKEHHQNLKITLDNVEAKKSLEKINLTSIEENISQEISHLERLKQRFNRSTLNIGVVGWTGQGKSTFLKSLSGLTDNEIPALEGGVCTAVRSTIQHYDGDTHAIVTFHSENSFLQEVISPYYEKLGFGNPPQSLDEFADLPFPEAPSDDSATKKIMYERLRNDYYLPLQNYRRLLETNPREIRISRDEIVNYVIQRRDGNNLLTTFNHLAVRKVKILCRFAKTEVNRLGLVDIPGLGDTRLGDEDLMLETLGREVDIVLFLRRPDSKRYLWKKPDIEFYDIVSKALPNFCDRAFLVLNYLSGGNGNLNACHSLRNNLNQMKFVASEIADCKNPHEANRILESILHYLDGHIEELELRYAQSCQNSLIALYQTIQSDLGKARHVMQQFTQDNKLFRRLFEEFKQNLANSLRNLVEDLAQQQDIPDPDFEAVVANALAACENDTGIPSEEEILNRARDLNLHDCYKAVYCILIPELRAHLSKNFLTLDKGLQQAANQLKEKVADVFIEECCLSN